MKQKAFTRAITLLLCVCLLASCLAGIIPVAAAEESTTVYFLNSGKWAEVGVYIYGDKGELLGGWPGATAVAATELGEDWMKIEVPNVPPYSVIFFNTADDSQRTELYIDAADKIYVASGSAFSSKEAAEVAAGVVEATVSTVYFYNADGWTEVYGYPYANGGDADLSWPGRAAEQVDDTNWWKVEIPVNAETINYNIIFHNNAGSQVGDPLITRNENSYVAVTDSAVVYASRLEAEIALGLAGGTNIYFLNSAKWAEVGAYIYGDKGELAGAWGATTAVPATELGDDWVKITVSDVPPFNIIFYNKAADAERAELYIPEADNIYVTVNAQSFKTQAEAENSVHATPTTIYFLNWDGEKAPFTAPTAYVYGNAGEAVGGWPGLTAAPATALGENWWQVEIPANASVTPFTMIFSDNGANQMADVYITSYTNNYVTAAGDATAFTSQTEAEKSVGITYETVVYYLNSEGWESIGAYVYGACGEALGSWPGADAEKAAELGENWVKVTVPAKPSFSIIFFNKADPDPERAELQLTSDKQVYVAGCKTHSSPAAYGSQLEAELAMGLGDPSLMTTLYFYNSRGWGDINGYVFREEDGVDVTVGAGWPGTAAEPAEDIGENWWKLLVPRTPTEEDPFYVVFNDGVNQTQEDILIDGTVNVYVTVTCKTFPTAEEAEAEAANDDYDDGCENGPNADIEDYDVTYDSAGAVLPYVTYEAEAAVTNAQILEKDTVYRNSIQTEASGRQAVKLTQTGDYVEFVLTEDANALVLRYAMPDSADGTGIDASLSLYVDGVELQDLALTSHYAWVYGGYPFNNNPDNGMAHRFFDETRLMFGETLPAGTTIRLQKNAGDTAEYYVVDFIECELVGEPLGQPENSLSVIDFGAVADDGQDDRAAFEAAIAAASERGKEVWIPAGTFDLVEEEALTVSGVTIRGAGMWYTNLYGAGAAFKYQGTSKFYDFSMTGVSCVRDDSDDLAGFEGTGSRATNVTIQNIWMEHMKVGVWSANTYRMVIQGCRIRNTYADGINLCSGTHDSVVRNNSLRNTGDDCIAIWPWLADCSGNTIAHNTIQVPTLANGVAIYGGGSNVVDSNHVMDTINNGAGIVVGSEFDTAKGYTGAVTVRNNLLDRCGSMQTDENYPIGAIWIWSSWSDMTTEYNVYHNVMNDCVQEGILIECNATLTGLNIQHNTINGAVHAVYEYLNGTGSGKIGNLTVTGITGEEHVDNAPNFTLTWEDEDIEDEGGQTDPTDPSEPEGTEPTEPSEPEETEPTEPEVPEKPFPFTDVPAWAHTAVDYLFQRGIVAGMGDTCYGSDSNVTRGQAVMMIWRNAGSPKAEGENSFRDVKTGAYYEEAVAWAAENGIVAGIGSGRFGPNDPLTREQLVVILRRLAVYEGRDIDQSASIASFKDAGRVSSWAREAMEWAVANGMISGYPDGTLAPTGSASRAEYAQILFKFILSENI